jgi:hypothetical protein
VIIGSVSVTILGKFGAWPITKGMTAEIAPGKWVE